MPACIPLISQWRHGSSGGREASPGGVRAVLCSSVVQAHAGQCACVRASACVESRIRSVPESAYSSNILQARGTCGLVWAHSVCWKARAGVRSWVVQALPAPLGWHHAQAVGMHDWAVEHGACLCAVKLQRMRLAAAVDSKLNCCGRRALMSRQRPCMPACLHACQRQG